jgi:hypothetical protein
MGLLRDLEQLLVQRHPLLVGARMQDGQRAPLRGAQVTRELDRNVLLRTLDEPRQDAHRIP